MSLFSDLDPKLEHFQCSYNVKDKSERLVLAGGKLSAKLVEGDLPFKKGSKTYPRSEFRSNTLPEASYKFSTEVCVSKVLPDMQYSVFQIFASNPEVMVRKRSGKWQIVVFSCKEKITEIPALFEDGTPNQISVSVSPVDKKNNKIVVDINGYKMECISKFKQRDKLYAKCGVYAQQMDPIGETIAVFNYLNCSKI